MGAGEQNPRPSSVPLDGIPMIALLGILSILALAALCSDNRRRIPLKTVGLALCLQVLFAALVLWLPAGQHVLNGVSESVSSVIGRVSRVSIPLLKSRSASPVGPSTRCGTTPARADG